MNMRMEAISPYNTFSLRLTVFSPGSLRTGFLYRMGFLTLQCIFSHYSNSTPKNEYRDKEYRCATIYSDPELIKSGLKSDKNKSFYTKIRLDPN